MNALKLYSYKSVEKMIFRRDGETKFGEKVVFIENLEELAKSNAKYVLFGIPEDIGVRANYGKSGTSKAWNTCLKSLLNIQNNEYTQPNNLLLLGEVDCKSFILKASNIGEDDPNYFQKLGDLVEEIDLVVSDIIEEIVTAGKIPIIIGGGHNNAFGNIKGTSKALNKPVNVLNIDAHTDLRQLEHRHSGNGFSYALKQGFLRKYGIFGLNKNYTPQYIFENIRENQNIEFRLFDDFLDKSSPEIYSEFKDMLSFVRNENFGLEVDCDAIKDFAASAQSPTGFTLEQVRSFIKASGHLEQCRYLHICEAAPNEKNESLIGKSHATFITDFMIYR